MPGGEFAIEKQTKEIRNERIIILQLLSVAAKE